MEETLRKQFPLKPRCVDAQIIPGSGKQQKGVVIKSHTSNSFIIEVRAVGSPSMPGWRTLRTLADVCKAAAVAVSCRNLDQLCAAALRQATRQMKIPGDVLVFTR